MALEAFLQERASNLSGIVHQQLCLDAVNAWRLLKGRDDVSDELGFELLSMAVIGEGEEVSDDALAALIDKK